jgi:TetR/AcrR family transcriptional regulator, regulator of cefoperazone and chloramphenicol sensitivity
MGQTKEHKERVQADSRRRDLVKATFDIVASEGFEGLRTRLVAEKAGVNVATLHYYFPTKEALIWALAEYLGAFFMSTHAPAPPPTWRVGLDRLRQEFADSRFYMTECKDAVTVMAEMGRRADRDPQVAGILSMMVGYWRASLADIVTLGVADGSFRSDLNTGQVTATLIALFSGLSVLGPGSIESIREAVEQWLVIPGGDGR